MGADSYFVACLTRFLTGKFSPALQRIGRLPRSWLSFAVEQDMIGWDNLMVGMVSVSIIPILHVHLRRSSSMFTAGDLLTTLISELLRITHRQWLYRNAVVHRPMDDGLTKEEQSQLFRDIVTQYNLGSAGLHDDDAYLLNVDLETLWQRDGIQKKYWLQAIKSARRARDALLNVE